MFESLQAKLEIVMKLRGVSKFFRKVLIFRSNFS